MKRILSLAFTILVALCIEVVMVMLIAHWWGVTAAVIIVAIESVFVLWMVYEIRRVCDETKK